MWHVTNQENIAVYLARRIADGAFSPSRIATPPDNPHAMMKTC